MLKLVGRVRVKSGMEHAAMGSNQRPIPLWLAMTLLSVTAVAGLAGIWKYAYRAPNAIRALAPTPGNPKVAGGPQAADERTKAAVLQAAGEADLPDGVHAKDARHVLIKAGDAYMRITPRDDPAAALGFSFGYFTVAETEWDHGYLSQGVRRLLVDEEYAKELGVTAEQVKKLAALPDPPPAKWPEKDRTRFVEAYRAWARAAEVDKAKLADELTRGLKEYGEKRRQADQELMADRVKQIKSILTERQVAKINPIPRWEVKPAAPKP